MQVSELAISIFIVNVFLPGYYITLLDWHKLWIVVAKEVMIYLTNWMWMYRYLEAGI